MDSLIDSLIDCQNGFNDRDERVKVEENDRSKRPKLANDSIDQPSNDVDEIALLSIGAEVNYALDSHSGRSVTGTIVEHLPDGADSVQLADNSPITIKVPRNRSSALGSIATARSHALKE